MSKINSDKADELRATLWGSFYSFIQVFFPLVTGKPFIMPVPVGRESHVITICRELTNVARGDTLNLGINVPPGHFKSTLICMWISWTLSRYIRSEYIYISYSHELAAKHTEFVRRIISNSYYRDLFGISIRSDIKAKDHFMTTDGAQVKAFGALGSITGYNAGGPAETGDTAFTGALLLDDLHKASEVFSDTIRQSVIDNYNETIVQRVRSPTVPIVAIGQCLHEDDIFNFLFSDKSERVFKRVLLDALDAAGNVLCPQVITKEQLLEKQRLNNYVFSAQYQQKPSPAGGALFREKDFAILPEEPEILLSFLTLDTAETPLTHNDPTVFSFWGLYKIKDNGIKTDIFALHWIDCLEIRVEPADLEQELLSFYSDCMLHKCQPTLVAIEQKTTGVTLISSLKRIRGLNIREVKRTRASGSKAARYIEMQPYISSRLISFTDGAKHKDECIKHMVKITANDSHRWDDKADTCYDSIKIALIDKTFNTLIESNKVEDKISFSLSQAFNDKLAARRANY